MNSKSGIFLLLLVCAVCDISAQKIFSSDKGGVDFTSDAPLELIKASSNNLRGLLEIEEGKFAFSVEISSFEGFNSPLQKVHFNENYMESKIFPTASFAGKIIENVDLTKAGTYDVRAKGNLKIHGIERERILRSQVIVKEDGIVIASNFTVLLEDHSIRIPKIVHQKISETIDVNVIIDLKNKS